MKAVVGSLLILAVVAIGFIPVDEATWLAWRPIWISCGGLALGAGIGLLVLEFVTLASRDA